MSGSSQIGRYAVFRGVKLFLPAKGEVALTDPFGGQSLRSVEVKYVWPTSRRKALVILVFTPPSAEGLGTSWSLEYKGPCRVPMSRSYTLHLSRTAKWRKLLHRDRKLLGRGMMDKEGVLKVTLGEVTSDVQDKGVGSASGGPSQSRGHVGP